MSPKVKRGLGLLVVAVIAWLIGYPAVRTDSVAGTLLAVPAVIVFLCALVGGLVLLAWGLLRE